MPAFDLSGGVFDSKTLDVSSEDAAPQSVRLSSDGTKAYVGGVDTDKVYQYTLTTAFDVSSGSYASKSLDSSGEMTGMYAFTFNSAGTKVYIMAASGALPGYVFQYNLSTAWDVSTGSYASKSMDPTSETGGGVTSVSISSDGTKAYVADSIGETVYQYTLSTPDDISSGSYASKSMSFGTETSAMRGMEFASNGEHAYIADPGSNTFYQYDLTAAWDISTGSYASKSMAVGTQNSNMFGIALSPDGTKAYGSGLATDQKIYQYKLADPVAAVAAAGWGRIPIGG